MRQGLGIQSWLNSMHLVPRALGGLTDQVNQSVARGEADILQKRRINAQKRAEETAERRRRQSLGMNIGIGVGGAALGAGLGAALAKSATPAVQAATAAGGGAAGSLGASAVPAPTTQPVQPLGSGAELADRIVYSPLQNAPQEVKDFYSRAFAQPTPATSPSPPMLGDMPSRAQFISQATTQPTVMGADGPMTPWAPGTPSEFPASFDANQPMPGPHTAAREVAPMMNVQPQAPSLSANIGTALTPSYQKFGYLGDNRLQVAGNLFLQGLGGVIPGMGGVAQGINSANQLNYQLGRDTVNDFYRGANLEINKKQLDVQQSRADALQNYYNWKQQNPAAASGNGTGLPPIINAAEKYNLGSGEIQNIIRWQGGQTPRPLDTATRASRLGSAARSFSDPLIPEDIQGMGNQEIRGQFGGSPMSLGSSSPSEPQSVQEYNSMIRSAASEDEAKRLQDIARRRGWIR